MVSVMTDSHAPSPRRTAEGRSAARERLLRTASDLFYAEGIHSVGVDRIVAEAGVTRATFYRHFPSKEDLVMHRIEDHRREAARVVEASAGAKDLDIAERLWEVSEQLTQTRFPLVRRSMSDRATDGSKA